MRGPAINWEKVKGIIEANKEKSRTEIAVLCGTHKTTKEYQRLCSAAGVKSGRKLHTGKWVQQDKSTEGMVDSICPSCRKPGMADTKWTYCESCSWKRNESDYSTDVAAIV
jgi:hypothetical protein